METYYLQPIKPQNHADIYCVVLNGSRKSFCRQFYLKDEIATTFIHTEHYLSRTYIKNYSEFKPIDAKTAKKRIRQNGLSNYLPIIQTELVFENKMF